MNHPTDDAPQPDDREAEAEAWLARLERLRRGVDLRLDGEGRWHHEGELFTHPGLIATFDRGIDVHPESGEPILRVGERWCYIEADDTAFVARRVEVEPPGLALRLNTGARVAVPPSGFEAVGDHLYVQLDARRRVRLGRAAQAKVGGWLEGGDDGLCVVAAGHRYPVTDGAG